LIVLAVVALLAVPSAALAEPGKGKGAGKPETAGAGAPALPNGAQRCAALRVSMTAPVFNSTYGANASDKNAFGKCVAQTNRSNAAAKASAASACRAEQADANFASAHDGHTFAQHYGANESDENAFGKCVAQKAKAKADASAQAKVKGAKACKTLHAAGLEAFKQQYRTFGKCVSEKTPS
jgi:hypothetical protein